MSETRNHSVTYVGTYHPGNHVYKLTVNVPEEVIKNQNALGWLKRELHDTHSLLRQEFLKTYPDFEVLATHNIENLEEVETFKNG
jgi:hypothetical protein